MDNLSKKDKDVHSTTLIFACMLYGDEERADRMADSARDEFLKNSSNGYPHSEIHHNVCAQFLRIYKRGYVASAVLMSWIRLKQGPSLGVPAPLMEPSQNKAIALGAKIAKVSKRTAEKRFKEYKNSAHIFAAFHDLWGRQPDRALSEVTFMCDELAFMSSNIKNLAYDLELNIPDWSPITLDPSNEFMVGRCRPIQELLEIRDQNAGSKLEIFFPHLNPEHAIEAANYKTEKRTTKERNARRAMTKKRKKERMVQRLKMLSTSPKKID